MAFKRLNYFKGFFLQAEDLVAGQSYHLEKRHLHNRALHTPGVVFGLEVNAEAGGTAVRVMPGYAIDQSGRDLRLSAEHVVELADEVTPPCTAYLVMRFHEDRTDRREDSANPEYSNYAFMTE